MQERSWGGHHCNGGIGPQAVIRSPRDGNVVSSLHCMNDPQLEGHMASHIGRREFLATLGGVAAAWPLAAHAQQPERLRRIGVLMNRAADNPEGQDRLAAFHQGLQELGWGVGRNVLIDTRWSEDAGACERVMTRDGTVGRSDATERSLPLHWDMDPARVMRPRFADSIRASSPSGLREQAGHMTASDFCAARYIFSCQAGPSTHETARVHHAHRRRGLPSRPHSSSPSGALYV
jgi:hypothetical protein